MLKAVSLFTLVAAAVVAAWWRMGVPVEMPALPINVGDKLPCVSYVPFRGTQSALNPAARLESGQIEEDLAELSKLTECVRTYSVEHGLDRVPDIARKFGLKVMLGLSVSGDAERTRYQIEVGSGIARRFPDTVRSVVVGSEALSRGEIAPDALAGMIRTVKARVPMPVTYADTWEVWLRHPGLAAAVDFVTVHTLPYRERSPVAAEAAASHVAAIRKQVAAVFIGKEVMIGEIGWPSAGRMRGAALPSPANHARFLHEAVVLGKRETFNINVREAYDQPWRRAIEGSAGGHWGLLGGAGRERKFAWGSSVTNRPHWPWQAAGGVAMAALVFLAGLAGAGRGENAPGLPAWGAVALNALTAGLLAGWIAEAMIVESFGWTGWLGSLVFAMLAVAAALAGSAAMASRLACPDFSQVLGPVETRPQSPLALTLGLIAIAVTVMALQAALGLAFDPVLRDFPFASLTAAAIPFALLVLSSPRSVGARPAAETVSAVLLLACAAAIAWNEDMANWQAMWFCGALLLLALTLLRPRAAPG
ncbi:MAG: beta-(1-6) glucans synthase [Alphaproteobacteria bacterium]|nr:beta-(1-6) glucans synthase [Alphaproteobacteria bacterium]